MHACRPCIWWSCNKSTFDTVHFDRKLFTCSCGGEKDLNGSTFGAFIRRFQSDGAASMAVKGLNWNAPSFRVGTDQNIVDFVPSAVLTPCQSFRCSSLHFSGFHWASKGVPCITDSESDFHLVISQMIELRPYMSFTIGRVGKSPSLIIDISLSGCFNKILKNGVFLIDFFTFLSLSDITVTVDKA